MSLHQQPTHLPVHDTCIVQGLAKGHIAIIGHPISRMTSVPPKKCSPKIWVMHPLNRMVFFPWSKYVISLGIFTEEQQVSIKGQEKKYMEELSNGLTMMATLMSTFPTTVMMQMTKKHNRYDLLHLWILCEPHRNKFSHVPIPHVSYIMINYIT